MAAAVMIVAAGLLGTVATAQNRAISGTVVDANGAERHQVIFSCRKKSHCFAARYRRVARASRYSRMANLDR